MSWYTKSFRRHLLDMHIADWDDRFLSEFDPETYVENLKTAQVQTAMLYLPSDCAIFRARTRRCTGRFGTGRTRCGS